MQSSILYLKLFDFISSLIILSLILYPDFFSNPVDAVHQILPPFLRIPIFIYTIVNGIGSSKLDLEDRISFMREKLEAETNIKEFDRQVFESIVDYVIVGGYNEEENADPSMITFVYRTGFKDRKNGDDFKPARLNASKKKSKAGSGNQSIKDCQKDNNLLADKTETDSVLPSKTVDDAHRNSGFDH